MEEERAEAFWLEGVFTPAVSLAGVLGNAISVLVLTTKDVQLDEDFVYLFLALCAFDLSFLILAVVFFALPHHSLFWLTEVSPHTTPVLLPLLHVAMTGSVYSVMAVACERYLIVCKPFSFSLKVRLARSARQLFLPAAS